MRLSDAEIIEELKKKMDTWRYADESKFVDVYPRPLLYMLDAVFRYIDELEDKKIN